MINAERFCEILLEEGYTIKAIKDIWDHPIREKYMANLTEENVRKHARAMKDKGWLDAIVQVHEAEEEE
jgi:hypothetical protein